MPTYTGSTVPSAGGGGTLTSVTGTTPVSASTTSGAVTVSIPAATTSVNGYLTSTDWNTFNNKGTVTAIVAGTGITVSGATGSVTVSASGGAGASTTAANTWTATQTFASGTGTGTTYGVMSDNYGQSRAKQFVQGNLVSNSSITYAPTTANNLLAPAGNSNCGPGNLTAGPAMITLTSSASFPTTYAGAIDPTGRFAFVALAQWNQVQPIAIDSRTGTLVKIGTPVTTGAGTSNPRRLVVDPTGRFLYVNNSGNSNVQPFTINQSTGAITAGTAVQPSINTSGIMAIEPSGRFLYITDTSNSGQVYPMTINQTSGALTTGTPVQAPGPCYPGSLVIDPSGRFMYATGSATPASGAGVYGIVTYTINPTTGGLVAGVVVQSPVLYGIDRVFIDTTGRFLFSFIASQNKIWTYTINQSTGALTLVGTSATVGMTPAASFACDPTGRFLYATCVTGALLATLAINQNTGLLTTVGTVAAPAASPQDIAIDPSGRFALVVCISAQVQTYLTSSFGVNRLAVGAVALQAYDLELAADSAGKPTSSTWTVSSDARIKTVSGPYQRGLSDVIALMPVKYRLNGQHGSVDDGKEHVSVIAQDAQLVWPEMIGSYMRNETDPETGESTQVELLNLNTNDLQWGLVNAIKELSAQNAEMKSRLDALTTTPTEVG